MGWLKQRWPALVVAVVAGLFIARSEAQAWVKVMVTIACMGGITLWNLVRNLRLHTAINRCAALGQPDAMLALLEPELQARPSAQARVPFFIYKATARALEGHWDDALALLDAIEPGHVRGNAGRTWRFLHSAQRASCLVHLERADDARRVLEDELVPFAAVVPSPATEVIVNEVRAKLMFLDGELERSREAFEALLHDERIMPASRAVYHYFLGRIALAQRSDASEHFEQAKELAPETFIPEAIARLGSG